MSCFLIAGPGAFTASSSTGSGSVNGSLSVNLIHPLNGQVLGSHSLTVQWTGNDTDQGIWYYEVGMDALPPVNTETVNHTAFSALADGRHFVTVWAHNKTGATAFDSAVFFVSTAAPLLTITSPGNNTALNTSDITVTWNASHPSGLSYIDARLDSGAWVQPLLPSVTSYTFPDVSDGHHSITVAAYDNTGNSTKRTVNFLVDTTYPSVTIVSPNNGTGVPHSDVDLIWTSYDAGHDIQYLEVWSNGALLATPASSSTFFHFTNLKDGVYSVMVRAVDQANSTAEDNVTFLVDTVEPQVIGHDPVGDAVGTSANISVGFSKDMNQSATTISVDGVSGTLSWSGQNVTFSPSALLAYGTTYTVEVNGQDTVGNPLTYSWSFTTTDLGTISGTVNDNNGNPMAGATVTLDDGASVVTDSSGQYSFPAHAGQHNLTISKGGYGQRTVPVTLLPGQSMGLAVVQMSPSDPLGLLGWIVAIAAVAIVALLIFFSYRRRKEKGPPARSWKGMDELQKRAGKGKKKHEEEEDPNDLL